MAINFGNKFNHPTTNYEQTSAPERVAIPRPQAREIGHRTLNACYGGIDYSDFARQLQEANNNLDSALDRANASAWNALNSVNSVNSINSINSANRHNR